MKLQLIRKCMIILPISSDARRAYFQLLSLDQKIFIYMSSHSRTQCLLIFPNCEDHYIQLSFQICRYNRHTIQNLQNFLQQGLKGKISKAFKENYEIQYLDSIFRMLQLLWGIFLYNTTSHRPYRLHCSKNLKKNLQASILMHLSNLAKCAKICLYCFRSDFSLIQ